MSICLRCGKYPFCNGIEEIDKIYKGIPEDEGNFAKAILIKEKQVLQELLEKRK